MIEIANDALILIGQLAEELWRFWEGFDMIIIGVEGAP